jgi:hypothetical protein
MGGKWQPENSLSSALWNRIAATLTASSEAIVGYAFWPGERPAWGLKKQRPTPIFNFASPTASNQRFLIAEALKMKTTSTAKWRL